MTASLPFTISLRPGEPVTQQVVYAVTRAVVSGQLRPGDPFPSVRSLSHELRVNPNTAHRIVSILTDDGILEVVAGVGTIIAARARVSGTAADLDDDIEALVVAAKRAGVTQGEIMMRIREHWSPRTRRTG